MYMKTTKVIRSAIILTILPLLAACSSDDAAQSQSGADENQVTINATITDAQGTRVSFSSLSSEADGIKTSWQNSDALMVYASSGSANGKVHPSVIRGEDHIATFKGKITPTLSEACTLNAYVRNDSAQVDGDNVIFKWGEQSGVMKNLGKYDIITGQGAFTSLSTPVSMDFAHNMAFFKVVIALPESFTATTADVTLKADNLYNAITWNTRTGSFGEGSDGQIHISSATVTDDNLTFYVAMFPGTITNLRADVNIDGTTYTDLLITEETTLQAGKLSTINRSNVKLDNVTQWITDDAWTYTYDVANYNIASVTKYPEEGSDWLNVTSDNKTVTVSATANTTGAPRQCKLTFSNGSQETVVDITQIETTDFAGDWDMTSFKVFNSTGSTKLSTYDPDWKYTSTTPPTDANEMKIYDGYDYGNKQQIHIENHTGTTATAYEGLGSGGLTATNNLLMTGLYENLKVEMLSVVNHSARGAWMSIFIDTNTSTTKAQRIYTGNYAGQYMALMPELRKTNLGAWGFNYATIGGAQRFWWCCKISVVGHTTTIKWLANSKDGRNKLKTSTSTPTLEVWGLQVLRYKSSTIDYLNLIRQGETTSTNAAYAITYQGDMVMTRTADGYKEIEIGGESK